MTIKKTSNEIKNIKDTVLSNFRKFGFTVKKAETGRSIYTLNGDTTIDLIYASLNKRDEYFFGIEEEQFYNIYSTNRHFFQIFICESSDQIFIIPLSFMMEVLKDAKANNHITFHQWKPIIRKRNGVFMLRLENIYEITDYLNRYDYLLNDENDKNISLNNPVIKFNSEIVVKTEKQKFKEIATLYNLDNKNIHSSTIFMLKKMGEWLGYDVITESKPKNIENFPYKIDCLWYKNNDLFLAIEVCHKGSAEKDKDALKQVKYFGARKVVIIADINKLERIRKLYMYNGEIKCWTEIWSFNRVFNMFENGQKFFNDFLKFNNYQWNDNIVEFL
jgi:hypothetical protein